MSPIRSRLRLSQSSPVQVLRRGAVVATLFDNTLDPGPQRLAWNGGGLPDGRYVVAVRATDTLVEVTQRVLVTVDRKPPALRVRSLTPITLQLSEPGTLVLAINGRWRKLAVKRAGVLRIGYRGTVRGVTKARDEAAIVIRTIRMRGRPGLSDGPLKPNP